MNYKDSVLIVYPPGGYGTFLEWALMYFSGLLSDDSLPFMDNGSSHLYAGRFLESNRKVLEKLTELKKLGRFNYFNPIVIEDYFLGVDTYPYVRTHGTLEKLNTDPNFTCKDFVAELFDCVSKIIVINVKSSSLLLILGNQTTKTKASDALNGTFYQNVAKEFAGQFGVDSTDNIPTWQLREMISYWHGRRLSLPIDVYQPILDEKCINIDVRDLVNDFASVLHNLADKLKIKLVNTDRLEEIVSKWLSLQKFVHSDQICHDIICNTLQNIHYHWQDLHMIEQAFIQWQLRDFHQLDLLCFELDQFPTNTTDLRKVLVPIEH